MKQIQIIFVCCLVLTASCTSRHNMADLQQKIDSIRALENKEYLKANGIDLEERSPMELFFDSLRIQSLPLQATAEYIMSLPGFTSIPTPLAPLFGEDEAKSLSAKSLPETLNARLMLLAVYNDIGEATIWLCSLGIDYMLTDKLLLYVPHPVYDAYNRPDTRAFVITSEYQITIQEYDAGKGIVMQQNYEVDEGRHFVHVN